MNENTFVRDCLLVTLFGAFFATAFSLPLAPERKRMTPGPVMGAAAAAEMPVAEQPAEEPEAAIDTTDVAVDHIEAVEPLVTLVAHGESETVGSYNAANNGRAMDLGKEGLSKFFGRDCSEVTIGEILLAQAQRRLHAVGRYQIIGKTLPQAIRWAGLSGADTFSPENQDRLFLALIQHKRPSIWAFIKGDHGSVNTALMDLSREWASMPTLAGVTYYGWGDRAHASVTEVVSALQESRSRFADL